MRSYFNYEKPLHFIFPLDGDCLNDLDGEVKNGKLFIQVKVKAPAGSDIYINENKAEFCDCCGCYVCEVGLQAYRTALFAEDKNDPENDMKITVFYMKESLGKYRISVDDNILFLQDINKNKDVYKSIFDNPFLAIFKKAHDLYDSKVHINIYYEFSDLCMKNFGNHKEYFNLTMMTDKFKPEFKANANWLKFSFHARKNSPDKPYIDTTYERMDADIKLVHKEMIRFMGEEVFTPVTTLHWGESTVAGVRALRDNGYQAIHAYFEIENGKAAVSLHYPNEVVENLSRREFWVDTLEDVICTKCDIILNTFDLDKIVPELERIKQYPHKAGYMEMLIHEQYFYRDYVRPIPYEEIILTAAEWATKNGYKPAFLSEVLFEPKVPY